jgi:hypothetical protein
MNTRLVAKEKQLQNWGAIIHECKNSGMKTKDWLAENNISKDQYYYWFRMLREQACIAKPSREEQVNQVVKIECSEPEPTYSKQSDVITVNVGDLNINIPSGADIGVIKTILEVAMNAK